MTIDLNGNELDAIVAALKLYARQGSLGALEIEEFEALAERLEIILQDNANQCLQPRNPPMGATHMTGLAAYRERVNAENLANQAPAVQRAAKEILEELKCIGQCLYWAVEPEEDGGQWALSLIVHAHGLLDLGHEYRAALKANPPPKE